MDLALPKELTPRNARRAPSDGHADTVVLIRVGVAHPAVLNYLGIGENAGTVAIGPDGRRVAIAVVKDSAAPHASPAYTLGSAAVLVAIGPKGRLRRPALRSMASPSIRAGPTSTSATKPIAVSACAGSRVMRSAIPASASHCWATPLPCPISRVKARRDAQTRARGKAKSRLR